ncbi:MAG: hypothetical protein KDC13_03260 [Bacteroidetes bacterium]|nr:hypothetical protein [Bacteroidota bacterium]
MISLSHVEKIDAANIGLMVISCLAAFVMPFELFLFAYAVLGPLHYLTEIGWLHKKGYFTTGKYDYIFLALLGVLITLGFLDISESLADVSNGLVYLGFLMALAMVLIKDNTLKVVAAILIIFSSLLFRKSTFYDYFFAIYLPTIIHVFIFTGLFILYGALKNKSRLGFASILVFALCAISFFFIPASYNPIASREYVENSFVGFVELNRQLINLFGLADLQEFTRATILENKQVIFASQAGFMVMRFIAFAYTYHYLNWFSKTSVIQWHKVPRRTLIIIGIIWGVSIALYAYDYMLGLKWLFLLSFLHVLLEFPLNYRSIIGIGSEFKAMFAGQSLKKA